MNAVFEVRIEWLEAPGVMTPELAATWGRYEIWVNDRCVTQVEATDGTLRRSVYGSLYPLAQWIASNWWVLTSHVRPSAVEARYWTWPNVRSYPWLAQQNMRGAGDGMAWPDLTIVVEGGITRIVWAPDRGHTFAAVRFASGGDTVISTDDLHVSLAKVVNNVLERLAEKNIPKTQLAEEWAAIAHTDDEERAFCSTVARMGLDPYAIDDQTAEDIIYVADGLPEEIIDDFFDSAEIKHLTNAVLWTRRAMSVADRATVRAKNTLQPLHKIVSSSTENQIDTAGTDEPWTVGYFMARSVRYALQIADTEQFDTSPWVGFGDVSAPSNGIQGFVSVRSDRCGLVLGSERQGIFASRFGQARALGRVLANPGRQDFILSAARGQDEKIAGAFAAELLAPADGIRQYLDVIGNDNDSALEAVAQRFKVSPLLVRHQYDNQIAATSHIAMW